MQAYEELKQQNDEVSKSSSSTSSSLDSASACEPELSELEGVTSELKRPLLSQYGEEDPFVDKYKTELGNTPRKRQQQSGPGIRLCFFALCIVLLVAISIAVTALTLGILDVRIKPLAGHGAPEKAIVLASYSGQNLSWLNEIPDDWKVYVYNLDDPSLPFPPNESSASTINTTHLSFRTPTPASAAAASSQSTSTHDIDTLTVPRNQGREAMAYLTFLITHYHHLPKYTLFLHGHTRSWHQPAPIAWKIHALSLPLLEREGYINLRCSLRPGCSADIVLGTLHPEPADHPKIRPLMPKFWDLMLRPEHRGWDFGPYPPELGQACCAQFGVTREVILRNSREFYEAYRRPMERDAVEYKKLLGSELWDGYRMGILYEHLWHIVFGKEALLCPAADYCREVFFQGMIGCNNYTGAYENSVGWEGIRCENGWDDGGRGMRELEEPVMDEYGGWDGIKEEAANRSATAAAAAAAAAKGEGAFGAIMSKLKDFAHGSHAPPIPALVPHDLDG